MRNKLKLNHKKPDLASSLNINSQRLFIIMDYTKRLLSSEPPMSEILEKVWNNKDFNDLEVIYLFFELGMSKNHKDTLDYVGGLFGKINRFKDE